MSIQITTEKIWDAKMGACRKLISVDGMLVFDQLPEKLTKKGSQFTNWDNSYKCIRFCNSNDTPFYLKWNSNHPGNKFNSISGITVGVILPEECFKDILEYIRTCGQALHEYNKTIIAQKLEWKGEETFII